LFRVEAGELDCSPTQRQLHDLHAKHRVQSEELAEHISWLESVEGFAGVDIRWRQLLCSVRQFGRKV
jgi:hypothetical protein